MYRLMALDALGCFGTKEVSTVATRTVPMTSSKAWIGRLGDLTRMTPRAEVGGLWSRTMNSMTTGAVCVRSDAGFLMLLHDPPVAGSTVAPVSPVGRIGPMRLVAETARVDVSVYDLGRDGLRLGGDESLSSWRRFACVTGWAACGARIARPAFFDELMARQARDLRHTVFMHRNFVVAPATGSYVDAGVVPAQIVAFVTTQGHVRGYVVLVTDRASRLRVALLIEMTGLATT